MQRTHCERARRIRDSNAASVVVLGVTAVTLAPLVSLFSGDPLVSSELLLSAS